MHLTLTPFAPTDLVDPIQATVSLSDTLHIDFRITGKLDQFVWPDEAETEADELWHSTCFEYFIGLEDGSYYEFNQSTSGKFAGYRFDSYRQGRKPSDTGTANGFFLTWLQDQCHVEFEVPLVSQHFYLGLSIILEDARGNLHYFSTSHGEDRPDFHDRSHHHPIDVEILTEETASS
jgi:hypothetical protein